MQKMKESKILICKTCKGKGTTEHSELQDYHRGEYKYWNEVCWKCKGTGRLLQTITTKIKTVPYDNSEVTLLLLKDTDDK